MKKFFLFIVFAVLIYLIYLRMLKFRPFVKPFIRRKCDRFGCGAYGASRDGGKRAHKGMDVLTTPGQPVFAPFGGKIRLFKPYPGYDGLDGVEIAGKVYRVKMMYVQPARENGATVSAGDVIGWAQSLQVKYPGISDHIHSEVWVGGSSRNPSAYFPPDSIVIV